jgi:hypothetical protein
MDSARHALYLVPETAYGVTPDTPSFERFRHTGATPGATKNTSISDELRPDRQIADFRHGIVSVGGELNFEFSYGSFDTAMQAALLGTWTLAMNLASTTVAVDDADNSYNSTGLALLRAGDKITVAGFTTPANNGVKTVVSSTGTKIVVAEAGLVDEASGDSVTIVSARKVLKAGVDRQSFTLMRHFTDMDSAAKPFHLFKGVELNTMSLSLTPGDKVTGSFGLLGREPVILEEAPAGSVLGVATTSRVFDSFTGSLKEGGTEIGIVTEITLTLENGLEARPVLFSKFTLEPSIQRSNLTGQITVYFEDATMLEKFLDETASSLDFTITDLDGNSYRFLIPNISYTGGQPDTTGQGSISLAMPFQAVYDPTNASQIVIEKIPASA